MAAQFTVRMVLMGRQGRTRERLTNPEIHAGSVVHIAASEVNIGSVFVPAGGLTIDVAGNPTGGEEPPPGRSIQTLGTRFVGSADVFVKNVSPQEGFVEFVLSVDWSSPLNVVTDITISEPPPASSIIFGS